jgi:hypothetical protein
MAPGEDRLVREEPWNLRLPDGASRSERALAAIREWIGRPGFVELVDLFGADLDLLDLTALRQRVDSRSEMMFGGDSPEGIDPILDRSDGDLAELVALEDLGDFCWNFRRGTPRAVLHLLHDALTGEPPDPGELPVIARRKSWREPEASRLRSVYLGHSGTAGSGWDPTLPAGIRAEVLAYPRLTDSTYRERSDAVSLPFDPEAGEIVGRAATDLGLVRSSRPRARRFDHVVVAGGGGVSPRLRASFAAELIERHQLDPGDVWLLGSPRPVTSTERRQTDPYAPGAADEFDLMIAGGEQAFARERFSQTALCGCSDLTVPCPEWQERWRHLDPVACGLTDAALQHRRQRTYPGRGFDLHVLSAATGRPPDRPNTADTYALLANVAGLDQSQRVLLVTTQVFVPFQGFDAIRMLHLPHGIEVEVVGFGNEAGDRPATPAYQLQEVLSGLRSARRLAVDALGR